jgi:hypothetical protein
MTGSEGMVSIVWSWYWHWIENMGRMLSLVAEFVVFPTRVD